MAYISKIKTPNNTTYDINAYKTKAIPRGSVDSTSTSTIYTATIDGITELRDGVCMLLTNSVVNSEANFTININNLGAKPVYGTMNTATRIATMFKNGYTIFLVYNETRVSGGCWDLVYYNTDATVTQTHSTTNAEKNLLMSTTTSTTTKKTEGAYKSTKLTFNPSTGNLTTEKLTTPAITLNGNDLGTDISSLYKAGSANILKNAAQTQTVGGVTFTMNADGSITANGTKTNNDWLYLSTGNSLKAGTYVLSSGGIIGDDKLVIVTTADTLGTAIMTTDTTTGVYERELTQDYSNLRYAIRIANGTVCNNVTFKPMLCEKRVYEAINGEFQPYAMSNAEITAWILAHS